MFKTEYIPKHLISVDQKLGERESEYVFQITFGISERNALTCLLLHSDKYGMRMPINLAPIQISIVITKGDIKGNEKANELYNKLIARGIRTNLRVYNKRFNCFKHEISMGTPVHLWFTKSMTANNKVIVFQRHNFNINECELDLSEEIALQVLAESNQILFDEQSKIKQESQFQFKDEAGVKNKSVIVVFLHNRKSCINKVSNMGLGEIIGFDNTDLTSKNDERCMACTKTSTSAKKCYIAHRI